MRIVIDVKHASRPKPHVRLRSWWYSSEGDGLRDHNMAAQLYAALRDDIFSATKACGAEFTDEGERK